MYEYRFLYLNQSDLMQRYPEIDRGMRRLMSLKRQATSRLATALLASVDISAHPKRLDHVADSMAMTLMFWLSFEQMAGTPQSPQQTHSSHRAAGALALCPLFGGSTERILPRVRINRCQTARYRSP